MSKNNRHIWRFDGPLQLLKQRAFLLAAIRQFFAPKKVLEVDTPVLSSAGNTDVQIEMFSSQPIVGDEPASYLRTSPEFFHKRLLASGAGDLFEIAKVFRSGERTPLHNPEFTLLEWYRLDFDMFCLMDEVVDLVQSLHKQINNQTLTVEQISYQDLFKRYANFNPFDSSLSDLHRCCEKNGYSGSELSRTEALDFMLAVVIQPQLMKKGTDSAVMIYHFPVEMAALAQVHPQHKERCLRFEFLWHGVELANGYQELTDASEQVRRFEGDLDIRTKHNKVLLPIDYNLIAALDHGLPQCSGVAMGVERLMMCLYDYQSIYEVMGFTAENS